MRLAHVTPLLLLCVTAACGSAPPPKAAEPPPLPPPDAGNNQGSAANPPPLPPPDPTPPKPVEPAVAEQQWVPGKYMGQAMRIVGDAARTLEQKSKFGFAKEHACLMGAYLKKGEVIDISLALKSGREYAFIGGGSQHAIDIDLGILDDADKVLKADMDKDPAPAFRWRPPADASYKVRLKLQDSRASGDFVALAVMEEGGYAIPAANLIKSFETTLTIAATASTKVKKLGKKGLIFHENKNWSFFGVVLKPGEMNTFSGFKFDSSAVVAAGGDDSTDNLDLFIKDAGNAVLEKDDAPDANPVVVFNPPDKAARYKVGVKQTSRKGVTLATVAILDIEN